MTPELAAEKAAEKAADMLDLAADETVHGDIVENRIAIADAWMRLHTALANAPKQIEPATPDEHYELGIDKILRRNEELKRTAGLAHAPKTSEPDQPPLVWATGLAMPINLDHPPIVRVASVDHKVVGWDFDRGIDGRVGAFLRLQLDRI